MTAASVRRRSRRAAGLVVALTAGLLAAGPSAPGTAGADTGGAPVGFRPPVVVSGPEQQQTEPQVVVTDAGTVLVGAQFQRRDCRTGEPRLAGSRACIWRSEDGGRTFTRSGGGENTGADVHFARLPSGTLLYTTLTQPEPGTFTSGVGGATILRSTDDGRTWTSTILNGLSPALDRPFLTVLGDSVLLTYTAPPGNLFVSRSDDDGRTFGPGLPMTPFPQQLVFTRPGGPAVDVQRGEVVQPYYGAVAGDLAINQDSQTGMLDLKVLRSADGGATWTDELVAPGVRPTLGMVSLAADDRGREYVVWSARDDEGRVGAWFSRNLGPGEPWSAPVRLGSADHSSTLAWVVARGDGGVAIAYVGSDFPDARTASRPWTVRVAVSRDAGGTWATTVVEGDPVYTGPQSENLSVFYDLFGLTVDDGGWLHLTFPRRVVVDGQPMNQIEYTRQSSGPPLGVGGQGAGGGRG